MVRVTNISGFISSLPEDTPQSINQFFRFRFLSKEEIKQAMNTLHSRGMLTFLPFGLEDIPDSEMDVEPGLYAIQLIPHKRLDEAPVVLCMEKRVVTIASKLQFFVPGMILFLKTNGYADTLSEKEILDITNFADCFGESRSVPALLRTFGIQGDELAGSENMLRYFQENKDLFVRIEDDSFIAKNAAIMCTVLHFQNTEEEVQSLIKQYPKYLEVWVQYLLFHCNNRTTIDISETLWKVLKGDYMGEPYGEILFLKEFSFTLGQKEELDKRLCQLSELHPMLINEYPVLWEAVSEYRREPSNYDGRKHLQFAKELEEDNPSMAYRQAVISAYFSVRLQLTEIYQEAKDFLVKLAKNRGWKEIEELLEY